MAAKVISEVTTYLGCTGGSFLHRRRGGWIDSFAHRQLRLQKTQESVERVRFRRGACGASSSWKDSRSLLKECPGRLYQGDLRHRRAGSDLHLCDSLRVRRPREGRHRDREALNEMTDAAIGIPGASHARTRGRCGNLGKQDETGPGRWHESQQLSEELQVQQEELRTTNEELEEHTRRLKESEEELRVQQEELQVTNEELEEKNELLQRQKHEVERGKKEIEDKGQRIWPLQASTSRSSCRICRTSCALRLNSLLLLVSSRLRENKEGTLTDEQVQSAEHYLPKRSQIFST